MGMRGSTLRSKLSDVSAPVGTVAASSKVISAGLNAGIQLSRMYTYSAQASPLRQAAALLVDRTRCR
jgi:hypothetical protein